MSALSITLFDQSSHELLEGFDLVLTCVKQDDDAVIKTLSPAIQQSDRRNQRVLIIANTFDLSSLRNLPMFKKQVCVQTTSTVT